MNKLPCRYAVVQFVPHAETGEFANVGVVLVCPSTGYFGFRVQTRKHARVTGFFQELTPAVYRAAVKVVAEELERVRALLARGDKADRAGFARATFDALVHPREAMVRFGTPRVLLTDDPEQEVNRLFEHYVDRAFVTPEYVETTMARRLAALLKSRPLAAPFGSERIGDDAVHAHFPLVQKQGGEPRKVIKPFSLEQREANDIYAHGDAWVQKIRRLRERKLLPSDVLFAFAAPDASDPRRHAAAEDIRAALAAQEVLTVPAAAEDRILEFAAG